MTNTPPERAPEPSAEDLVVSEAFHQLDNYSLDDLIRKHGYAPVELMIARVLNVPHVLRTQLAAKDERIVSLEAQKKELCDDWSGDHTHLETLCKQHAVRQELIKCDPNEIPSIQELVNALVAAKDEEIGRLKNQPTLTEALAYVEKLRAENARLAGDVGRLKEALKNARTQLMAHGVAEDCIEITLRVVDEALHPADGAGATVKESLAVAPPAPPPAGATPQDTVLLLREYADLREHVGKQVGYVGPEAEAQDRGDIAMLRSASELVASMNTELAALRADLAAAKRDLEESKAIIQRFFDEGVWLGASHSHLRSYASHPKELWAAARALLPRSEQAKEGAS